MEPVCQLERLVPGRGVAALLSGGVQVAVFRLSDGSLHAVSNRDPFTGSQVISRGIVGDRSAEPTVASPLHKQVFSLRTGRCLDDPHAALDVHAVDVRDGTVRVGTSVGVEAAL
ncbi:MAG: nitrite reductase small subunit NirD [Stackebrandtia sp.]